MKTYSTYLCTVHTILIVKNEVHVTDTVYLLSNPIQLDLHHMVSCLVDLVSDQLLNVLGTIHLIVQIHRSEQLIVWLALRTVSLGHSMHLDVSDPSVLSALDLTVEGLFEISDISDLTALRDAPAVAEPLPAVVLDGLV